MRGHRKWLLLAGLLGAFGAGGCSHCCGDRLPGTGPASCYPPAEPPRRAFFRPLHPLAPHCCTPVPPPRPPDRQFVLPPAAAAPYPPGVPPPPVPVNPAPVAPVNPPPPAANLQGYGPPPVPPPDPGWRPAQATTPGAQLAGPEPEPPLARPGDRNGPTPPLPVGIPQFATPKKGVASGLKPSLDGLDWLKANGYRTVLHLRRPGTPDAADRKQIEEVRGLKYCSLEVSPETLALKVVDQFNHLVNDANNRPLFVYDKDGVLAGALWYLHFRMIDQLSDADARARAAALGLKTDGDDEQRAMWLAVQKVLSGQQPRP
ncbi:MAG TPA: hypothetical protein VFA26_02635 [Gemmataceae bacterium]|nr:hypothetical protein [Gemmataceae bacterium]